MLVDHLIFFACWVVYYGLHSILASTSVKNSISPNPTVYRFLYSLFSTIGLATILLFGASIFSPLFIAPGPITTGLGLFLATYGIFIIKRAFRNYRFREFVGIKKEAQPILKTDGLQAKIRHPLYSGIILLVLGYVLFNPMLVNVVSLIALIIYLPIGIWLEEKKLIQIFGQEYENYKKSVPSIIPKFINKNK